MSSHGTCRNRPSVGDKASGPSPSSSHCFCFRLRVRLATKKCNGLSAKCSWRAAFKKATDCMDPVNPTNLSLTASTREVVLGDRPTACRFSMKRSNEPMCSATISEASKPMRERCRRRKMCHTFLRVTWAKLTRINVLWTTTGSKAVFAWTTLQRKPCLVVTMVPEVMMLRRLRCQLWCDLCFFDELKKLSSLGQKTLINLPRQIHTLRHFNVPCRYVWFNFCKRRKRQAVVVENFGWKQWMYMDIRFWRWWITSACLPWHSIVPLTCWSSRSHGGAPSANSVTTASRTVLWSCLWRETSNNSSRAAWYLGSM